MKRIFLIITVFLINATNSFAFVYTEYWAAGSDFEAEEEYSSFGMTNNSDSIYAVHFPPSPMGQMEFYFYNQVDMSPILEPLSTFHFDFDHNPSPPISFNFKITLYDSEFEAISFPTMNYMDHSYLPYPYNMSISSTSAFLALSFYNHGNFDLTKVIGFTISDFPNDISISDFTIYGIGIVPEPSTYSLILGALVLGFVAYRRK